LAALGGCKSWPTYTEPISVAYGKTNNKIQHEEHEEGMSSETFVLIVSFVVIPIGCEQRHSQTVVLSGWLFVPPEFIKKPFTT